MKIALTNLSASLTIDLFGGAIIDFHLKGININPLNFSFSKEQMPENNKSGAPYQGHFLCLGRWGEPSTGEINAGIPNHGEITNINWELKENMLNRFSMETTGWLEGLKAQRIIELDKTDSIYAVKEVITNINPLGRLYNMVQHPTLAAPFLDESTIIDCNATAGFDQALYKSAEENIIQWPYAKDITGTSFNLQNPQITYNAVFSFIVNRNQEYGWITAYSLKNNLLFGYVWKRNDYPWIHLWQHWLGNKIQYRGIEFGTAGIHQPFNEILNTATNLFGENTFQYIDAGESISKNYFSFIYKTKTDIKGVEYITITDETIKIKTKADNENIIFFPTTVLMNGVS